MQNVQAEACARSAQALQHKEYYLYLMKSENELLEFLVRDWAFLQAANMSRAALGMFIMWLHVGNTSI